MMMAVLTIVRRKLGVISLYARSIAACRCISMALATSTWCPDPKTNSSVPLSLRWASAAASISALVISAFLRRSPTPEISHMREPLSGSFGAT